MEWPHEREHYRIVYPSSARPLFVAGIVVREVVDVSEQGIRFRLNSGEASEPGDPIDGLVRFRRGEEVKVTGTVVRVVGQEVAVHLSVGVPLRIIIDEQRYLREHHRGSAW